jgi:histone acetyltransferase (RNA polymerase elongator complex component)
MPNPYSNDLRERVINYLEKGFAVKDAVKTFNVKKSAIYKWKKSMMLLVISSRFHKNVVENQNYQVSSLKK